MNGDPATVQNGATVLMYLAAALVAGASLSTRWIAGGHSRWSVARLPALRRWALGGAIVALLACLAVLCLESAAMAEVPLAQAGPAVVSMLSSTHYGMACCIGAAALACAVALNLFLPQRLPSYRALGTMAALAVFWYTRSMVSHAASDGDFSLALVADWGHLALISIWVGEVFVAGSVMLSGSVPERDDERRDRAAYVVALSGSATFALAGIFATGLFGAWRNLNAIGDLFSDPYGETLVAKLAVVGLAALLGGSNRFWVMPAWLACESEGRTAPAPLAGRFRMVLRLEALVLFAALVLAVALAATSPPGSAMAP